MQSKDIQVRLQKSISRVGTPFKLPKSVSQATSCLNLVGSKIFSSFFDVPFGRLMNALAKVETRSGAVRQQLIRAGRRLEFGLQAEMILGLGAEDIESGIGPEFLLGTARKVAKSGRVSDFSEILEAILGRVGYDKNFLKAFFISERNGSECIDLLELIRSWEKKSDSGLIFIRCFLVSIEKLATQGKPLDMVCVFEYFASLMKGKLESEESRKITLKALSILIGKLITSREDPALVANGLRHVVDLGLEPTEIFFNKLLDHVARMNGKKINNKKGSRSGQIRRAFEVKREKISGQRNLLAMKSDSKRRDSRDYEKEQPKIGTKLAGEIYEFMIGLGIKPSTVTFNSLIETYSLNGEIDSCFGHFASLLKFGLSPDHQLYNSLSRAINNSNEKNNFSCEPIQILELYRTHKVPLSSGAFNSMIDIYIAMNKPYEAQKVFQEMRDSAMISPDSHTFNSMIKSACKSRELDLGLKYIDIAEREMPSVDISRVSYNAVMDLAVKMRRLTSCLKAFEAMRKANIEPDAFSYSILLNGLKQGHVESSAVKATLLSLKKMISETLFKPDEIFFNSVLDVCCQYEFFDMMEHFKKAMHNVGLEGSHVTYGIMIKARAKQDNFSEAESIFTEMVSKGLRVNDVVYGSILDSCAKSGQMEAALRIYEGLEKTGLNLNSIVFTTIIKGFMRAKQEAKAIEFFRRIEHHTNLVGMIITYNCALDAMVQLERMKEARILFDQIENLFTADLVSYSTLIKGLCVAKQKQKAFKYVQKMLNSKFKVDVSVVNLFLDFCSNSTDFRLGISAWKYAETKKIKPNEVTFGILIKLYGFSRELNKAFELVDLMKAYGIPPSIIIFTNLVHISFYSRKLKRVEKAFALLKKQKLPGDRLLYSKLVDGFLRVKDLPRAIKYMNFAFCERIPLKTDTCNRLEEKMNSQDLLNAKKLEACRRFRHVKVAPNRPTNSKNSMPSKVADRQVKPANRRGFVLSRKGFKASDSKNQKVGGRGQRRGFGTQINGEMTRFSQKGGEKRGVAGGVGLKTKPVLFNFRKRKAFGESN